MDVRRRLGLNLKRLREEQGFSQEGFADHCGLHRTYISGIERGVRNPTVVILDKIAKGLKVPAGQISDDFRGPGRKQWRLGPTGGDVGSMSTRSRKIDSYA